MKQYLETMQDIIDNGYAHEDRTGVGRISVVGVQLRFDLSIGFPLVTTRRIFTKALIHEMLWFIRGCTDVTELTKHGVNIWNNWTLTKEKYLAIKEKYKDEKYFGGTVGIDCLDSSTEPLLDTIGPMYGHVWRNSHTGVDQLKNLITNLKEKPYSSRHVVTAWIPELVPDERMSPEENIVFGKGALAPCHAMFQCFVKKPKEGKKPKLSLVLYQR